jgi:glycosyltransferase involved in cell wall biosynthesis
VANSEGLKRLTESVDPYQACVIPSGVDAGFYSPGTRPADGVFRVLFVGRFHPQKNLPMLVEQFARAMRGSPGRELRLDLIGDGPERAKVEAKIASLGLQDRVGLSGWISRDVLLGAYRAADCLVNPSSGEGLPNVVLEAMACGVAIVGSRVAGNDTLVRHEVNVLLFEMSRPDELGDALARLAADPQACRDMGAHGREAAVAEYSWASVAKRYAELFTGTRT